MPDTIKSLTRKIKAKLGFHRVPDTNVLKAGNTAYEGLFNNSAYPNTPVPLQDFRQALDSFSALIVASEDGGKKAISAKQNQRAVVIKLYTLLGHYVEAACDNDLAKFNTSGFTVVSATRMPPQPLTQPKFSSIDRGPNSGQTVVKVESLSRALAFDVRYGIESSGGTIAWTTITLTSAKKVTLSGLTPAGTYQFQVRALGKLGYTDWSPSTTFIAA